MPVQNLEYNKLVTLLKSTNTEDIYEELLKKEDKVLDTVNRVVNYSNAEEVRQTEFENMSMNELTHNMFWTLQKIGREAWDIKTIQDVYRVMFTGERKFYLGVVVVMVSLFLFFVIIST